MGCITEVKATQQTTTVQKKNLMTSLTAFNVGMYRYRISCRIIRYPAKIPDLTSLISDWILKIAGYSATVIEINKYEFSKK
jgi:hypothetical protein